MTKTSETSDKNVPIFFNALIVFYDAVLVLNLHSSDLDLNPNRTMSFSRL